jgi:hypothetical protein
MSVYQLAAHSHQHRNRHMIPVRYDTSDYRVDLYIHLCQNTSVGPLDEPGNQDDMSIHNHAFCLCKCGHTVWGLYIHQYLKQSKLTVKIQVLICFIVRK